MSATSAPKAEQPPRSPYLKEKIKADAIHSSGGAGALSSLMSEYDSLQMSWNQLNEELARETGKKQFAFAFFWTMNVIFTPSCSREGAVHL